MVQGELCDPGTVTVAPPSMVWARDGIEPTKAAKDAPDSVKNNLTLIFGSKIYSLST